MVTSIPMVLEVHPWKVRCGGAGYGSKEMSNGREWVSDGRKREGSVSRVMLVGMSPAEERAGASAVANPSLIILWTLILHIRTHLKMWSPNKSTVGGPVKKCVFLNNPQTSSEYSRLL